MNKLLLKLAVLLMAHLAAAVPDGRRQSRKFLGKAGD